MPMQLSLAPIMTQSLEQFSFSFPDSLQLADGDQLNAIVVKELKEFFGLLKIK